MTFVVMATCIHVVASWNAKCEHRSNLPQQTPPNRRLPI